MVSDCCFSIKTVSNRFLAEESDDSDAEATEKPTDVAMDYALEKAFKDEMLQDRADETGKGKKKKKKQNDDEVVDASDMIDPEYLQDDEGENADEGEEGLDEEASKLKKREQEVSQIIADLLSPVD